VSRELLPRGAIGQVGPAYARIGSELAFTHRVDIDAEVSPFSIFQNPAGFAKDVIRSRHHKFSSRFRQSATRAVPSVKVRLTVRDHRHISALASASFS
jgi:hypothetical protein